MSLCSCNAQMSSAQQQSPTVRLWTTLFILLVSIHAQFATVIADRASTGAGGPTGAPLNLLNRIQAISQHTHLAQNPQQQLQHNIQYGVNVKGFVTPSPTFLHLQQQDIGADIPAGVTANTQTATAIPNETVPGAAATASSVELFAQTEPNGATTPAFPPAAAPGAPAAPVPALPTTPSTAATAPTATETTLVPGIQPVTPSQSTPPAATAVGPSVPEATPAASTFPPAMGSPQPAGSTVLTGTNVQVADVQPTTQSTPMDGATMLINDVGVHSDSDVCLDSCSCWPVWTLSILVFCFYTIITFIAFYMTAALYSQARSSLHCGPGREERKGLVASNFYRGGGNWLFVAGGTGLAVGGLVGGLVPPSCWAGALYLGGSLMSLLVATVLVGRRGAWLGALGGLGCGGVIGAFIYPSMGIAGIVASTVVGLLLGIVLGFAPIFRGLKINERYICSGLRSRTPSSHTHDDATRNYDVASVTSGQTASRR
ncbi:transmembrane domain-containing protein [Cyclospora cayetanensis]|uniref:Transmembrane domain-containing protein n=1 Tax=Cyclospora cayetanensis TaxID=88456 RepID=A0A1D3DB14_9EIME|nr:transmembrane domain-containing protein [Cyclospora cayetanensis]